MIYLLFYFFNYLLIIFRYLKFLIFYKINKDKKKFKNILDNYKNL